ncbi:Protein of unknown function [Propionibacterium freudenreichii]|nr:Protein of unknown function [Propionibacterium freudenreichii]
MGQKGQGARRPRSQELSAGTSAGPTDTSTPA